MKPDKLIDAMNDIKDEYILEAREEKKTFFFKPFIKPACMLAACACIVFMLIPRANYRNESMSYKSSEPYYDTYNSYEEEYVASSESPVVADSSQKKIVVNSSLSMETKDLEDVVDKIEKEVKNYGGYIQSSSISTYDDSRTSYISVRVPSESLDEFIEKVKEMGNTTFYSKSQDDVTDYYVDSQSRLDSLKKEEERVLEFYEQAKTVEELITVEQRLTEIQTEIAYLEDSIKNIDQTTIYSNVSIDVTETTKFSANGNFISRIGYAFSNGWENFVYVMTNIIEFIVYNWVFITAIDVIGIIIYIKKKK